MNEQRVVLMADDDEHDVLAMRRAWRKLALPETLVVVDGGEACLDYLWRRRQFADPASSPRPQLLLLDLNMPGVDGVETLRRIRADETLAALPVVMLTNSRADEDRVRSHAVGANAYVVKPIGFDNLVAALRTIHEFWRLAAPPEPPHGKP